METKKDSFCKALFHGDIREDILFPYPAISNDEAESVRMMIDGIDKFRPNVKSGQFDRDGAFPDEFIQQVAELGLMGLAIPESYGGLGLSSTGYVRVTEEISTIDGALAVTLGAHQSIGFKALTLFGSDAQKKKYYPGLASGETIACFALTEPGSGSDAGSIKTRAVLSDDGTHYILNGEKIWITNGSMAKFITVFAKTEEPDGQGGVRDKITAFIVDAPAPGITYGPPEDKMGIRASKTTAIHFENVKIPAENVLGGRGKGFKIAMEVLNNGRLGLAGGSLGGCRRMIKTAIEHANTRKQFGKPLNNFGMIQEKIARMVVDTFAAESMIFMTTGLIDRGDCDYSLESAISKVFTTETLWQVSNETLQILGGMGYMRECGVEQVVRDCRINLIFEGANEVLRLFIALSGLQGPGQELAEVARAIKEPLKGIGLLSNIAAKNIRLNVVGVSMLKTHPLLKREAGVLEDYVGEFALQCQKLLQRHGKSIADKQFACKRIADITIDLFAMSCVLARVSSIIETRGADKCEEEIAMAVSFFTVANRRVRGNFKSIDRNDDDQLKLIAAKACERGHYGWDVV
ncbi:MAG TPA: acyl-CoA dehydrogenase family protein [Oligoflexia bacterium]|nr:acyl-CoA dehydrogenase family protein [Oligoflexia bacterium]